MELYFFMDQLTLGLQVYIPRLSANQLKLTDGGYRGVAGSEDSDINKTTGGEKQQPVESRGSFEVRDDLLHSTHKFLQVIDQTLRQLEGMLVSI